MEFVKFTPGEYLDFEKDAVQLRLDIAAGKVEMPRMGGPFGPKEPQPYTREEIIAYNKKWDPYNPLFNDPEYAREHYSDTSRFTVVTGNDGVNSLLDMELMSHCRYNICANSTFSFWGARLNKRSDKEMIRTFKMRNNQEVPKDKIHDYWKDWILIDEKGTIC